MEEGQEESWEEWDGDDIDASWVGEPSADYSNHTRNQFLDDLERRLKLFMVRCVKACRSLPREFDAQHFAQQLIRSSSSAAANFRASRRG